jgi:hypothetical protein
MSKSCLPKLQLVNSGAMSGLGPLSGRVTHDSRGNAVWDWALATGVLARKTVAELIMTLDDSGELALDTGPERVNDWSGDPYNRSVR